MNFIDKLEQKLSKYCIKNLTLYMVVIYAIGFLVYIVKPELYTQYMALDMGQVMKGQIWRLVTWLAYPPSTSVLFGVLMLYVYFIIGTNIERICGEFKYNCFVFGGLLLHMLVSIMSYVLFRTGVTSYYLALTPAQFNVSIFLAYMILIPDAVFLLFFIIPIKAKVLGIIYGIFTAYEFYSAFKVGDVATCVEIVVSLANLLIFWLAIARNSRTNFNETLRRKVEEAVRAKDEQKETIAKMKPANKAHHKCAICGKTDLDDPNMEFRYCSKCSGDKEYCADHLFTHVHDTGEHAQSE